VAQDAEQLGEETRTDDERDSSLRDRAKDLGRRPERSDDRRDENARVDDDDVPYAAGASRSARKASSSA
jgi:hypothetical protein